MKAAPPEGDGEHAQCSARSGAEGVANPERRGATQPGDPTGQAPTAIGPTGVRGDAVIGHDLPDRDPAVPDHRVDDRQEGNAERCNYLDRYDPCIEAVALDLEVEEPKCEVDEPPAAENPERNTYGERNDAEHRDRGQVDAGDLAGLGTDRLHDPDLATLLLELGGDQGGDESSC